MIHLTDRTKRMSLAQISQWAEFQSLNYKGHIMKDFFKIILGVILMLALASCGDNNREDEPDACVHVKAGLNSCNCTCGDVCVIWRDAGNSDSGFPSHDTDLAECVAPSSH